MRQRVRQRVITVNGNRMWTRPYYEVPQYRIMTPPELLRRISAELATLGCHELSKHLSECASEWDSGLAPAATERLCQEALRVTGLSESSQTRLDIVLEELEKYDYLTDELLAAQRMNFRP